MKKKIQAIPPEIAQLGQEAIDKYLAQIQAEGTQKLFEAKVMLVGYGVVGKTSIIKKMLYNEFDEHEKMTIGIKVDHWKFTHESENDFRINVWDFGGQEVNYPTHQFFLTKRSIYVKVWEHRQYSNLPNLAFFDYWLNIAKLYGDQSPIIVVQNKIDERYMGLPQLELQEVFGVHRFIDVSAKEGTGIHDLKNLIERLAIELPHAGQDVPRSWFEIRRELEQHNENFISIYEYFDICKKHGLERDKALDLSDFFHDLGIFLHFKHTPLLHDLIFLKSDWTTNVVYRIMHNVKVQRAFGKFHYQILAEIWNDYPEERYPHFLALMQKFQMCLPLGDNEFLVPELLAADPPKYEWDYKENVRFEFSYKFMPAGLMTQFIWRLFDMLEVYWKSGAVITYKETRLLVRIFIVERKVSFWLKGKNTEETLNFVRWEFDKIHRYLQNPLFKEMFPCNCSECTNSSEPAFYEYPQLRKYLQNKITEIRCPLSVEAISINRLLGKYNGGSAKTPLFEYIFRAAKKLQGLQKPLNLGLQENNRTTFIANELSNSDYIIKDQALWGQSASGKQAGEMDIKIENKNRETIAIIEAFNLKSFVQKTISTHIDKLINRYDANGLPENYILVYCENNFEENWNKYIQFVPTLKTDFKLAQFDPHYSSGLEVADIKTAKAVHVRNGSEVVIYHFFVKISSHPI